MSKSFELQIKEFENMTAEKSELLFKKVCFDLSNSIIMDSPVDTGRLRSNFQPDIDNTEKSILESEDKSGSATVAKVSTTTNKLKLGQYFTLTNNLDYAIHLEFGTAKFGFSPKSPKGFIGINVMRFQNFVNQANKEIK